MENHKFRAIAFQPGVGVQPSMHFRRDARAHPRGTNVSNVTKTLRHPSPRLRRRDERSNARTRRARRLPSPPPSPAPSPSLAYAAFFWRFAGDPSPSPSPSPSPRVVANAAAAASIFSPIASSTERSSRSCTVSLARDAASIPLAANPAAYSPHPRAASHRVTVWSPPTDRPPSPQPCDPTFSRARFDAFPSP